MPKLVVIYGPSGHRPRRVSPVASRGTGVRGPACMAGGTACESVARLAQERVVNGQVVIDHAAGAEPVDGSRTATGPVDPVDPANRGHRLRHGAHQRPRDPLV